jgi:hypothetical protein
MGCCYLLVIFIERGGLLEVEFLRSSYSVTCTLFEREHADDLGDLLNAEMFVISFILIWTIFNNFIMIKL